jgi:hypothetical protein
MAKGKGKGSAYEREKCREFSLWITEGKRDDLFWRSPTSGGRATTRAKKGLNTYGCYGDILCVDPEGLWLIPTVITVEIKKGYTTKLLFSDLIERPGAESLIYKFWQKIKKESAQANSLFPLLIFRRACRSEMVLTDFNFTKLFRNFFREVSTYITYKNTQEKLILFNYQDLLRLPPNQIKENSHAKLQHTTAP